MRPIDADALKNSNIRKPRGVDSYGYGAMVTVFMDVINDAPTIPNATAELKKLALELLELYEQAEECVIWGYYGKPDMTNEEMEAFVKGYRERIEKLCP